MERSADVGVVIQRVGAGAIAGAVLLFALAFLLLAEIAALLVIALGLGAYALEQRRDLLPGLSVGLVLAAVLPILDRQLDPLGATLVRSTATTVAIGAGLVIGAWAIGRYGEALFGRGS